MRWNGPWQIGAAPCARLQLVRGPVRCGSRGRPFNGIVRPHQMPIPEQRERDLARLKRYRILRNWALVLGVVAIPAAWIIATIGAFSLADSPRRFLVSVLISASFALLMVGGLLHGLSRRDHGEV